MKVSERDGKKRCFGNKPGQEFYADYHDNEWGIPEHDDRKLFEMLILEGAQAGLSWETVLRKREGYRKAFYNFDVEKVMNMTDAELEALRENPDIIRNKLKIYSARKNALAFRAIQKEFGSFSNYLWAYVDNTQVVNHWQKFEEVPVTTEISDAVSKDLKKRGMSFVGSTIIYAYMQAVGLVDDHLADCWCRTDR
ncbi:DNA-3-methyladenine glycosylase I [Neptuniibacter sp. QD29_5]|uniref:DNA-3-methyladenine glycosylase I n=1 Tax=Neptuniibacter sp. QD29_5 TaxID=3398207 RepID=UPI0039F57491